MSERKRTGKIDGLTVNTEEEVAAAEVVAEKKLKVDGKSENKSEKKLKSEIELLRRELEELKEAHENEMKTAAGAAEDKYLRIVAEYDNFRRRSREEKDAVYSNAVSDTVSELLPLFDNLELASKYTGDNATEAARGVEMILSSVPGILEKIGVTAFGEAGEQFDPNIHNAVMHVDGENYGENEIVDVFQKGYKHGERVIRFAMVRVAN